MFLVMAWVSFCILSPVLHFMEKTKFTDFGGSYIIQIITTRLYLGRKTNRKKLNLDFSKILTTLETQPSSGRMGSKPALFRSANYLADGPHPFFMKMRTPPSPW